MDYMELDCTVKPREPFSDIIMAELAVIGYDMFEEHDHGLKAYCPADKFNEQALHGLEYLKPNARYEVSWTKKIIPYQNWNEEWERNFEPVSIAEKIFVRAPFHQPRPGCLYDIIIEPKMAFGTGHHETTSLVMSEMLTLSLNGRDVLDMGCGSGILAVLAAKMGASGILAVDSDEKATENAIANCNMNGCSGVRIKTGSVEVIGSEKFDCILANINRNIILEQFHVYASCLRDGGNLLLSGFYEQDAGQIRAAAASHNLSEIRETSLNRWTMLHFGKP